MKKLFRRLSMFFAVGAMIFGSGLVAHDNKSNSKVDNIVARALDAQPIAIDGSKTKVEGAGVFVFLADKPRITVDDIIVVIKSYDSDEHSGVATNVMNNAPAKVRYNADPEGEFYFTIAAGVPNGCDARMVVNISYVLNGVTYSQNITFVGNAYQPDLSDEEKVADVIEKINAIGIVAVTNASKALIDAAREAYDKLDSSLKSQVTNYEILTAAEAEYERLLSNVAELPIAIDGSKTKVEGSGIHIYLSDKPDLTIDDFTMTVVSFESEQHAGDKAQIMSGITKVHYFKNEGWLHGTIKVGLPNGHDQVMVVNISYMIGSAVYSQNITFVGNVYQPDLSDEEKIANVEEKINAIGIVAATNASKALIDAARDEYNKLDDSLKSRVTNYETLTAAEAEYERLLNTLDLVERPVAIDASQTKMVGAGIEIYLADKPNISMNDFTVTAISFESTKYQGYKDNMMRDPEKLEYNSENGRLYIKVSNGFDQGFTFIFNVTYTIDSTIYTQNITIVDNAYQPNRFPSITNAAASDLMPSTNGESTSDRYFLNGNVLEITDETNGAFSFVDLEGNEIDVISSSLLDTTYADMTNRLNRKDDVVVYGAISNKDGEAVINSAIIVSINRIAQEETFKLISEVISADTCNDYSKAADYRNRYNELSTDKQNIFDSIVINCKANKDDTSLSETVSLGDKLAYMETINAREATKSEASLLNSFVSSNNISIILVVGLLGLAAIAGYYFLNKKKYC